MGNYRAQQASANSHDQAYVSHEGYEKESETYDVNRASWSHSCASHQACESQRASSWNHEAYASQIESEDESTEHAEYICCAHAASTWNHGAFAAYYRREECCRYAEYGQCDQVRRALMLPEP